MNKLTIFLLLIIFSCDSIKDVAPNKIYLANIPENSILTITSQYADAKNIVSEEIITTKFWKIKLESKGQNWQLITDAEGDIIDSELISGADFSVPSKIFDYFRENLPNAAINSIAQLSSKGEPQGFEVKFAEKNELNTLFFGNLGELKPSENQISKLQIQKIISTNNNMYLADNEFITSFKNVLENYKNAKFELKLIGFSNGQALIEFTEIDNPAKSNARIDFLFNAKHELIGQYTYLSNKQISYTAVNQLDSFNQLIGQTNGLSFQNGLQKVKFGVQNSSELIFTDAKSTKYITKLSSKNAKPIFNIFQKMDNGSLPNPINSFALANNFKILNARKEFESQKTIEIVNAKTVAYHIDYELTVNNGTIKKRQIFDENFNQKK